MYVALIPVKNEADYIENVLKSLCEQTLKPADIIIIDDNSSDNTRKIASSFDSVTVIHSDLPDENHLVTDQIGTVLSQGIRYIRTLNKTYDYVLLTGGDDVLSTTYMEKIIQNMKNDRIDLAAGRDPDRLDALQTDIVTGSGTVCKKEIIDKIDLNYLSQGNYETYLALFAEAHGYTSKFYDLHFHAKRRTGSNYTYKMKIMRGKAYRAFGVHPLAALYLIIIHSTSLSDAFFRFCGLCSFNIESSDPAIKNYINLKIKKEIRKKLKI